MDDDTDVMEDYDYSFIEDALWSPRRWGVVALVLALLLAMAVSIMVIEASQIHSLSQQVHKYQKITSVCVAFHHDGRAYRLGHCPFPGPGLYLGDFNGNS